MFKSVKYIYLLKYFLFKLKNFKILSSTLLKCIVTHGSKYVSELFMFHSIK
jgi:hypothetical protein